VQTHPAATGIENFCERAQPLTEESLSEANKGRGRFGLRGRLLFAFAGISMFAVVAGLTGQYAFNEVRKALDRTKGTIPPALAAVELARESEQVLAVGPRMLSARTDDEVKRRSMAASDGLVNIGRLVDELRATIVDPLDTERLTSYVTNLRSNLSQFEVVASERVRAAIRREKLVNDTFAAYHEFRTAWGQHYAELQGNVLQLRNKIDAASNSQERQAAINRFELAADTLEQIEREASVVFEFLTRAANTEDTGLLQSQASDARNSVRALQGRIDDLERKFAEGLIGPAQRLNSIVTDADGLFVTKTKEIEANRAGQRLLIANIALGDQLATVVEQLVDRARRDIDTATAQAYSVQTFGGAVQLGVVALSLISSVLIVWLYVGRNIVARLMNLSGIMTAIAGGSRSVAVPVAGTDEIGAMGSAVEIFRRNAVDLDRLLAERAEAATRLERLVEERTHELAHRQAELRVTFDNMGDGVVMFNEEMRLAAWNRNLQEILDLPDSFFTEPRTYRDYIAYLIKHGEFGDVDLDAELQRQVEHADRQRRIERTRPDGRVLEIRVNPVPGGGFVAIYSDITERKKAEERVRAARDAAEAALRELKAAQNRLVQTEKLASLGQLTAGIAHEIKNPLNFVNNFSAVSVELIDELREALAGAHLDGKLQTEISEIADMLQGNLDKVVQHGKRADSIVKNMLLHSRQGSGDHRPIDINALVEESLNLAYHGARAEKPSFNITLERCFDQAAGEVDLFPQEITRVLLNLISNGFYAATKRKADANGGSYEPTLAATTKNLGDSVEIKIRDNGTGIPPEVKEKMFNPFFTTKPAGEGTGLGLSLSHDIIVKQHAGSIEVDTKPGEFTEFRIVLPRSAATIAKSGERA
jgi:PAS domain S-box-containing protein